MKKVIIGLGNPGPFAYYQRHSIGFRVVDEFIKTLHGSWQIKPTYAVAQVTYDIANVFCIKPLCYMNESGVVVPWLKQQGIQPQDVLVIHDELELVAGKLHIRYGGSARGHNGLKSLIEQIGYDFWRLRFGISRPSDRAAISDYVLSPFDESEKQVHMWIRHAIQRIDYWLSPTDK